jgi:hypothetical protein
MQAAKNDGKRERGGLKGLPLFFGLGKIWPPTAKKDFVKWEITRSFANSVTKCNTTRKWE